MANENNISPNDQNRLLARKIGDALPNIDSLQHENDPFLSTLLQFKKTQSFTDIQPDSDALWNAIHSKIGAKPSTPAKIFFLYSGIKKYAVAAAIVIAALIGIIIYQSTPGSTLISESFAAIERVELPDGSTVTLRPYSKLYKESITENERVYRLEGEAYFEVTFMPNRIFSVTTNRSKVEVLGTKFILSDWGNASSVFLEEGRIQYSAAATQKSVILEQGQASQINEQDAEPVITQADEVIYKDWLADELVFQDESAAMIFSELEQHFNVRIESDAAELGEDLSGSVMLDSLQAVLNDLELVLGGTFTQTGERSYTFSLNQ